MRIRWHFIGRALPLSDHVHLPEPEQMQLGGLLLVPSAGDQVVMITKDDATHVYLKCKFRRFDLTSIDGPVVNAPEARAITCKRQQRSAFLAAEGDGAYFSGVSLGSQTVKRV